MPFVIGFVLFLVLLIFSSVQPEKVTYNFPEFPYKETTKNVRVVHYLKFITIKQKYVFCWYISKYPCGNHCVLVWHWNIQKYWIELSSKRMFSNKSIWQVNVVWYFTILLYVSIRTQLTIFCILLIISYVIHFCRIKFSIFLYMCSKVS